MLVSAMEWQIEALMPMGRQSLLLNIRLPGFITRCGKKTWENQNQNANEK